MKRAEAKRIAETISDDDLKQTLVNARKGIRNWRKRSKMNGGMTKGAAFNVLSKCDISVRTADILKVNILREFGEWMPGYVRPAKRKAVLPEPAHQEPRELDNL